MPKRKSLATRQRVQSVIDRLGYMLDLVASNLATNTTQMVAAIIPSLASSVFVDTMHALSAALAQNGYQLLIGDSDYFRSMRTSWFRRCWGAGRTASC